jgi:hypothetical protein
MWSDNPGLYEGATVSVSDISSDSENNHNYYGNGPTVAKILSGSAKNAAAGELKKALPWTKDCLQVARSPLRQIRRTVRSRDAATIVFAQLTAEVRTPRPSPTSALGASYRST